MKNAVWMFVVTGIGYLMIGCSSGPDSNDTCIATHSCSNGGEIQACVTPSEAGYYLLRGARYDCTGSGASIDCVAAAAAATSNCSNPGLLLKPTSGKSAEEAYLLLKMENLQLRKNIDNMYNDLGEEIQQGNQE